MHTTTLIPKKMLFGSLFLLLGVFVLFFNHLPPQIPLYYSKPEGEETIGSVWSIFIIPLVALFSIGVNKVVFRFFHFDDLFVSKVLYWVNVVIIAICTFAYLKIIFLVS